ncbi:rRNA maturation RNase YbeY [Helicobacter sp. 11S03491-1]|uniref:rRNA maturation RNase YbeY n=1 Tax=Helicobacter sp. 11S03491-1 TaxID=1476196 RepID=UPI000BA7CBCC|nr:rRNA maturation RNase YbeY [Helicobacter sp. 11S03491-1]PAF43084.1 rRNA maturation RNase YbeY [Helicobacter sp. 11S03491-1]
MLEITNETDFIFDYKLLNKIAAFLSSQEIELLLTHDEHIHLLNKEFLGKDKTTDVLSFPFDNMGISGISLPLGSIVINVDMARRISQDLGHLVDLEIALLLVHGILHLLGYDHERDKGEHRLKEEEVIDYFKLPKSLIIRNT